MHSSYYVNAYVKRNSCAVPRNYLFMLLHNSKLFRIFVGVKQRFQILSSHEQMRGQRGMLEASVAGSAMSFVRRVVETFGMRGENLFHLAHGEYFLELGVIGFLCLDAFLLAFETGLHPLVQFFIAQLAFARAFGWGRSGRAAFCHCLQVFLVERKELG